MVFRREGTEGRPGGEERADALGSLARVITRVRRRGCTAIVTWGTAQTYLEVTGRKAGKRICRLRRQTPLALSEKAVIPLSLSESLEGTGGFSGLETGHPYPRYVTVPQDLVMHDTELPL